MDNKSKLTSEDLLYLKEKIKDDPELLGLLEKVKAKHEKENNVPNVPEEPAVEPDESELDELESEPEEPEMEPEEPAIKTAKPRQQGVSTPAKKKKAKPPEKTAAAAPNRPVDGAQRRSKRSPMSVISTVTFVVALLGLLFTVVIYVIYSNNNGTKSLFGYSSALITDSSMGYELPNGSLVFIKNVDSAKIRVGDDITYLIRDDTTVTHRVISIIEDYNGSGARVFETRGLANAEADESIVFGANIVGTVVAEIDNGGAFATRIGQNMWMALVPVGVCFVVSITLGIFSRKNKKESQKAQVQVDFSAS